MSRRLLALAIDDREDPAARVFLKYNTKQLEPARALNARYRLWVGIGSPSVYQHFSTFLKGLM